MKRYAPPCGKWGLTLALVLLLFLCRDSLLLPTLLGFYKTQFLTLGLILVLGLGFLAANFRRWKELLTDRRLLLMLGAAVICLLPMVGKGDWQLMYFSVLLCLLLGIFFSFFGDIRELAKIYVAVMTVLAVYSVLAAYVLRLGVDNDLYSVPVLYNSVGVKFYNFILSCVPETYVKDRNFGIFREPGVYQFFLLLGLYLNNDLVSWEKSGSQWVVNGILAVTMVSTFATGGVIEMGLLAVLLFFDKGWYRQRKLRMAAAALIAGLAVLVIYCVATQNTLYWAVYDMVYGKFLGDNESGSDRILSITVNLKTFLGSPLVGEKLDYVLHSVLNNTSSTMLLFAGFGILAGGVHLLSWGALVWRKGRKTIVNFAYLIILLMSFNTQNLIADPFLWLFPMMALTDWAALRLTEGRKAAKEDGNGN